MYVAVRAGIGDGNVCMLGSYALKHKTSSLMRSNMPTSVIFWKLCLTNSKIHITTLLPP